MHYDIKVGSISWIDGFPSPISFAGTVKILDPEWIMKTYMGLRATKNPAPEGQLNNFKDYQSKRNFRALTYLHFSADIEDGGKKVANFKVHDAVHDPGWTPDFKLSEYPSSVLAAIFDKDLRDSNWYQGEASDLSVVYTQRRHQNTAIDTVPKDELVLANAIIKFRAGEHTDKVGIRIGSPYHVPWVWNEWALTFAAGKFKLYVRASKFPSHAWYFNGKQVHKVAEIGDVSFPLKPLIPNWVPRPMGVPNIPTTAINVEALTLYPILSAGASASGPQAPNGKEEKERTGAVDTHPHTGPGWSTTVIELGN